VQRQGHGPSENPDGSRTDFSRVSPELIEAFPEATSDAAHRESVRRRRKLALARFGVGPDAGRAELAHLCVTQVGVQRYLKRLFDQQDGGAHLAKIEDVHLVNRFAPSRGYVACEICRAVFWTRKTRTKWHCDDCIRERANGVKPERRRDRIAWWAPECEPALQRRPCQGCIELARDPIASVGPRSKTDLCEACRKRGARQSKQRAS
jgi:hypothetical protein